MRFLKSVGFLSLLLSGAGAWASAKPVRTLTFRQWREAQIKEATSEVQRALLRREHLKREVKPDTDAAEALSSGRFKTIAKDEALPIADQDLKRAEDARGDAAKLRFEDYVEVYLSTLKSETLKSLLPRLGREELTRALLVLIKRPAPAAPVVKLDAPAKF